MKKKNIGLYVHVPFCKHKCNYCDFYSLPSAVNGKSYAIQVAETLVKMGEQYPYVADTLYFGGGTPTMLTKEDLTLMIKQAKSTFHLQESAEITCEINPGVGYPTTVEDLAEIGVNRLSVGLQSAVAQELQQLGRRHTVQDAKDLVLRAKKAGIPNISLDLMWGIPGQTVASALQSLEFVLSLNPTHISAYMLKIEENTPFGKNPPVLPTEDTVCDIYEKCCKALEQAGFPRYEISNFAKQGFESRHNLKYWNCENTLGIGPAAHSFVDGKRFYYPRDLQGFMQGELPIDDGFGGDFTEYAMLQLRLAKGLQRLECEKRFGHAIPEKILKKAKPLVEHGLMAFDGDALSLTTKGNLVSNEILATIL
jgi:oxygen-independent coproporphyrinogen-3 oxidase